MLHDTRFTGLDLSANVETTRRAAREALYLFAAARPDGSSDAAEFTPASLPESLSSGQQAEIATGCYELLLVLADAVAELLPTENAQRQAERARRILDQAARLRPPTRAYYLRRAACLTQSGDSLGGAWAAKLAEDLQPASAVDHFLTALERAKRRNPLEAIVHCQAALRLQPDHFWAQFLLATCYLNCQPQRPIEAHACLTVCRNLQPNILWTYLVRGYAASERAIRVPHQAEAEALFADAEADYAVVAERGPDADTQYILLLNRGALRLRQHRWPEALADFQAAVVLNPKLYHAYLSLAGAYQQQKLWAAAREQLAQAQKRKPDLDPRDWAPLQAEDDVECGREFYRSKKYVDALRACESALKLLPEHSGAHQLRVSALLELKRYAEVQDACDMGLAKGMPVAELYEVRGDARAGQKDFAGAIDDYTRALALRPGTAFLHIRRGWAYVYSGASQLALADFEKAIQLDPTVGDAYNGRGQGHVQLGQYREAIADAKLAIQHGERTYRLLYNACRIYAQTAVKGEWQNRSRYEQQARQLLGMALDLLEPAEREAFREVVQADPALRGIRQRR